MLSKSEGDGDGNVRQITWARKSKTKYDPLGFGIEKLCVWEGNNRMTLTLLNVS